MEYYSKGIMTRGLKVNKCNSGYDVKSSKSGSETQRLHVFTHMWKIDPKINIYTKPNMITQKLRCRTCL
jgi:hypothetical protein